MSPDHDDNTAIISLLERRGVRPTRQRVALAGLLFSGPDRHVTPEELHREASVSGFDVSLATVYNTLNHLRDHGLVDEISVAPGRSYFDTNTSSHMHVYHEDTGQLWDAGDLAGAADALGRDALKAAGIPAGAELARVDVVVRVRADRGAR